MDGLADSSTLFALMQALEASSLGTLVRTSSWLYPLASVLHILGLSLLLAPIAVFDLRVLGFGKSLPLASCLSVLVPIAAGAFALQLATGFLMFAADASHTYDNPYFLLKLALIGAALLNILAFHFLLRGAPGFARASEAPSWAKRGAAISLLAWMGVAGAGRMIAYV